MVKKFIFLWFMISFALFSQSEEIIKTLPRKENAYLDIEVTKLKIKPLQNFEIDSENNLIHIDECDLKENETVLLSETLEVFDHLFSVNNNVRLETLKNLTKQTNITFRQNLTSNHNITINYTNFPKELYLGIWDKNERKIKSIYGFKLPRSSTFILSSLIPIWFSSQNSITSPYPIQDKEIEISLGKIKVSPFLGIQTNVTLSFMGYINFKVPNSSSTFRGELRYRHNNTLVSEFKSRPRYIEHEIVAIVPVSAITAMKKAGHSSLNMSSHSDSFFYKKAGIVLSGFLTNDREYINDLSINFSESFGIIQYFSASHPYYLEKNFSTVSDIFLDIGKVTIKNAQPTNNQDEIKIKFSTSDIFMEIGRGFNLQNEKGNLFFRTSAGLTSQGEELKVKKGEDISADIVLKVSADTIRKTLELQKKEGKSISIYTKANDPSIQIENNPGYSYPSSRDIYEIILIDNSEPERPTSSLTIDGLVNNSILIDHGILEKGKNIYEASSNKLVLSRENRNEPLLLEGETIDLSFENSNSLYLTSENSSTSIETNLSFTEPVSSADLKSASFVIKSTLLPKDVNNAAAGNYSGKKTLFITIQD